MTGQLTWEEWGHSVLLPSANTCMLQIGLPPAASWAKVSPGSAAVIVA